MRISSATCRPAVSGRRHETIHSERIFGSVQTGRSSSRGLRRWGSVNSATSTRGRLRRAGSRRWHNGELVTARDGASAGLHHVSGHRTVRASFGDYAWFTGQACLFLGMLAAPFIQRRHMPWTLRGAGLVLIVAGGAVAAEGYTTLGEP